MLEKRKIPKVRFKGFDDDWEQRKLGEVARFSKGNGYTKNDLIECGAPVILYGRLYTKYETVINDVKTFVEKKDRAIISEGNEVVVPSSGETAEDIARASAIGKPGLILGGDLNIIKPNKEIDSAFLALMISNGTQKKEMTKLAQGKSIVHLHNSDLKRINLLYPKLDEQNKVSKFILQFDNLITLHHRKIENLKEFKKSMLQKMFPNRGEKIPEIQFEGFEGKWVDSKTKDILIERNMQIIPNANFTLVSFTVESGVTPKTDRYNREFLVRDDNKKYKITKYNDIVYNPANLKFGAIDRNKYGNAVFSPIYITFEINTGFVPEFIELILTSQDFIKRSLKFQEGTVYERMSVKPKDLLNINILVTSLKEQQKIASFFKSLDNKIKLEGQKLELYQSLKNALLQRMFV